MTKFNYAPLDFARDLNAHLGSAFSLEPIADAIAPGSASTIATTHIPNLYFVGAGTHPGAGIPGVVGSAKATAALDAGADMSMNRLAVYCGSATPERPALYRERPRSRRARSPSAGSASSMAAGGSG